MNTKKLVYQMLHYPCILLLAMHEYWFLHKDSITYFSGKFVREVKGSIINLIPQVFKFIVYLMVSAPIAIAFMLLCIKLS